jgi:hypothetical protein
MTRWDEEMRPRRNAEAAFREYDGESVVVLPSGAEINVLNPVGGVVFRLLDGSRTVGQVVDAVCEEYDVPRDRAVRDVEAFLDELRGHRLLS